MLLPRNFYAPLIPSGEANNIIAPRRSASSIFLHATTPWPSLAFRVQPTLLVSRSTASSYPFEPPIFYRHGLAQTLKPLCATRPSITQTKTSVSVALSAFSISPPSKFFHLTPSSNSTPLMPCITNPRTQMSALLSLHFFAVSALTRFSYFEHRISALSSPQKLSLDNTLPVLPSSSKSHLFFESNCFADYALVDCFAQTLCWSSLTSKAYPNKPLRSFYDAALGPPIIYINYQPYFLN